MTLVLYRISIVLIGSLFLSIGINFFLIPFKVLDGGIIGLALIINYIYDVKVGFSVIVLSIPVYAYAWLKQRGFFYNSIIGMLISSFLIDVMYPYQFYFTYYFRLTPLTSSIIGGLLVGLGIGLMLRNDTSISGADMFAQIIAKLFSVNVGIVIFILDAIVITLGGILLSVETFLLSIATITSVGLATSLTTIRVHRSV